MTKIEDYAFPSGLHLLKRWQAGEAEAKQEMKAIFDAAIAGDFDDNFTILAPTNEVHATASVHMLGLGILHDLFGVESREYYKTDPYRYVRVNLTVGRLLGVNKHYMTWAMYAFACEAIGQVMMYPDKFPPGSDPAHVLITKDNWHELKTPDFTTGTPKAAENIMRVTEELTGMAPLLQISGVYSLVADIYGQEPLLTDVVHDPDTANAILNHVGEVVLGPWFDQHMETFPNGWVEMGDASGSPFFIGPGNCKHMSIRAIQHFMRDKPYAARVYDNNYRGDNVAQVEKKARKSSRRSSSSTDKAPAGVNLQELTDAKVSVNPVFIMRLAADYVDVSFYEQQAIERNLPLTVGIGSPQIDRNSLANLDVAKAEFTESARTYVAAIKNVCETVDLPEDNHVSAPWASHIYFEDINGESQFDLVEVILNEVYQCEPFERKDLVERCRR